MALAALTFQGACGSSDGAGAASDSGNDSASADDGGNGPDDSASGAQPAGWEGLHAAIFKPSCALGACHGGPKGIAGLSFETAADSYEALIDQPPTNGKAAADGYLRVRPGEPETSFLLRKVSKEQDVLEKEGHGATMPVGNLARLGPKSLAALEGWIAAGAPYSGAAVEADFVDPPPTAKYVTCDATDEAGMRACFPPATNPAATLRLFTPPLDIPAGKDVQFCSILADTLSEDLYLTGAEGLQFNGGHHIVVYSAAASLPAGTVDCNDVDMSALRFVVGAGGVAGGATNLPPGMALRVPKGQQLVIQSHYINTSAAPIQVMDVVDIRLTTAEAGNVLADSFAMVDSDFEIPPFTFGYERTKECTIDQEMDIVLLLGHTHDYGTMFTLEYLPKGGGSQQLYYATDGPTLKDNPEVKAYETPLHLSPGDKLRMTCAWDNDTAHPLAWPEEMCVTFTYYAPGRGWLLCDSSDETPQILGGGEGEGCVSPDATGNSKGVGTYCTPEGGQCANNGPANFCLTNFSAENNYCSIILCASSEECGEGASCIEDSAGSACILDACSE